METIRTINLLTDSVISSRDITTDRSIYGIDINQVDGSYAVVEPTSTISIYGGRVVIYPQSGSPIYLQTFNRVGGLFYPWDAKFDYVRNKLWIADTGNNRVLKVNLSTYQVDLTIDDLIYPHAIAVDLNDGSVFIRGYQSGDTNYGIIHYFRKDGTLLATFGFNHIEVESSTSSQSSGISTSSSSATEIPSLSSNRSIAFDHVRTRLWWVDGVKVYMVDIRNKQVQSYNVTLDEFVWLKSITIEFSTGNAFIVAQDNHFQWELIQMNRDNNQFLGSAYISS